MNYALQRIWGARQKEFESYGITLVAEQNMIVMDERVIRLAPYTTTIQLQRILRPLVRAAQEKQAASLMRKQVTLFEEEK